MKNKLLEIDYSRYSSKNKYVFKLLKFFRKAQSSKGACNKYYRYRFHKLAYSHGIEFSSKVQIGPGFYIGHPFNITINEKTVIGKNCNIHKGVTIGQENRGNRIGTPVLGDSVWIGVNATLVGNISVGSNVLIAANSFVNVDVPDNSIVIGNPCKIIHCLQATDGYINNKIDEYFY